MKMFFNKKKKNKSAQMQMGETVFVIFIILIIIVIGFTVYSKFYEGSIKEQSAKLRNERIISTAHRLSSWSELECSVAEVKDISCFDTSKLNVFSEFINDSRKEGGYAFEYYHDLLRDSKILVRGIYPYEDEWVLYNNPGRTASSDRIIVPVTLYNPFTKKYSFGLMELYVYE